MSGHDKRVDLRFGSFACTVQGFDDPLVPLSVVLREVGKTLATLPALGEAGPLFDPETLSRLEAEIAGAGGGTVTAMPGLVLTRSELPGQEATAGGGLAALDGLASAAGAWDDDRTEPPGPESAATADRPDRETGGQSGEADTKNGASEAPVADEPAPRPFASMGGQLDEEQAEDGTGPSPAPREPAAAGAAAAEDDAEQEPTAASEDAPEINIFAAADDAEDTASTPLNVFAEVDAMDEPPAGGALSTDPESAARPAEDGLAADTARPAEQPAADGDAGQPAATEEPSPAAQTGNPEADAAEAAPTAGDTAASLADDQADRTETGADDGIPSGDGTPDDEPASLFADTGAAEEVEEEEPLNLFAEDQVDPATGDDEDMAADRDFQYRAAEGPEADNVTRLTSFRDLDRFSRHSAEDDDDLDKPAVPSNITVVDVAKKAGASAVPELIGASAAWLALVRGHHSFTRREVLDVFDAIPGEHPKSLEAKIKGFGRLVRNGQLKEAEGSRFALSNAERDRYEDLIT